MKEEKGITLLTLTITIVILLILTFTIGINAPDLLHMRRKSNFENDMNSLKEEIDQYYARYDGLPIINKYTNISMLSDIKNVNDNENYYVIDLSKISVNLNYGKDYETVKAKDISEEISDVLDLYIINEESHTIYYPKGIEYNDKINYTLDTYTQINTYIKASLEIENVDTKSVKLIAKGINVGGDRIIDSYNFYIDGTLKETVKTTDETASYNFNTTFGDYIAYVELKDTEGNTYKSNEINYSDYTIETSKELATFRDNVNNGNFYKGKTITLLNDIDLSDVCGETIGTWTPIGKDPQNFKGIFDGRSYTIKNLYVKEDGNFKALFGNFQGTVKNLSVTGNVSGNRSTSGIVGLSLGTIEKCKNYCKVENTEYGKNETYAYIGGIVGKNHGIVKQCINYGEINGITCVGGVAGVNVNVGTIQECINIGNVNSIGVINGSSSGTAGISGNNQGVIEKVYNRGDVTAIYSQVGGIVGWQGLGGSTQNAYSTGNISGPRSIGGTIGMMDKGNICSKNLYATGTIKDRETSVTATKTIGDSSTDNLGTIIGAITTTETVLEDNYFYTTQEVMSGWTQTDIDKYLGENFTKDVNNINDGYPILKWQL